MRFAVKLLAPTLLVLAVGCERPYQRFVPFAGSPDGATTGLALDTKTGQACFTGSKSMFPGKTSPGGYPFCYDLFKGPE
jgi:hypothetical protein